MTRVRVVDRTQLAELAQLGYELADMSFDDGAYDVWIVTSNAQRAALRAEGYEFSTTAAIAARGEPARNYPDFDTPVSGIADRLSSLAMTNTLVTMDTLGLSLEGRPIQVLKIGPPDEDALRPNVVFAATMHAREWISLMMALGLIDYLVDTLASTPGGQSVINQRDIWIIPMVNPDGYQYTHDLERLWRKNRRENPGATFGVDLNRNFPGLWGYNNNGSSGDWASEIYRGAGPASEPETEALVAFHRRYPSVVVVSYHSFGNHVLFPYSHEWGILAPDYPVFANLAGSVLSPPVFDRTIGTSRPFYTAGPGWQLYPVNGDYTEWLYQEMGTFAFTVELTAGCCDGGDDYGFVFPDDSAQIAQVVSDNIPFAVSVIEAAADPNTATGPGGMLPQGDYFESAWPAVQVVAAPASIGGTAVARGVNGQLTIPLRSGALGNGTHRNRRTGDASGVRLPGTVDVSSQLRGAVLHYGDPDDRDAPWSGFETVQLGYTRELSWFGRVDTLTSPEITTWGYERLRIAFWTRHSGSIGRADLRGSVDYSVDQGSTWTTAEVVIGNSLEWYPVSIPIVQSATSIRFRFVADNMHWWIDAVQILGDADGRDLETAPPPLDVRVSENPVRSDRVYISWPPSGGMATVKVFTFRGDLVFETSVPSAQALVSWDLRNVNGAPISNGAYIVVVQLTDSVVRKRLFVARP